LTPDSAAAGVAVDRREGGDGEQRCDDHRAHDGHEREAGFASAASRH
jgi:hypothetical protein